MSKEKKRKMSYTSSRYSAPKDISRSSLTSSRVSSMLERKRSPNQKDNDGKEIANYRGIGLADMINSIKNNEK